MINKKGGKNTASTRVGIDDIDFNKIRLINQDNVMFVWVDELYEDYEHSSGLVIARTLSKTRDRWGMAVRVGDNSEVKVGEYILPEKCKDDFGAVYEGIELWTTTDDMIFVVSDDITATYQVNQ